MKVTLREEPSLGQSRAGVGPPIKKAGFGEKPANPLRGRGETMVYWEGNHGSDPDKKNIVNGHP